MSNTFARKIRDPEGKPATGTKRIRIRRRLTVMSVKSEPAQYPQNIFPNPALGITDKPNPPLRKIANAIERIMQIPVRRYRHRINREVPTLRIFPPIGAKLDHGVAAVSFYIPAISGDFEGSPLDDGGDGAMLNSSRNGFNARILQDFHDPAGKCIRSDINVTDLATQNTISHTTANKTNFGACPCKYVYYSTDI
jgi:hypothetical protein